MKKIIKSSIIHFIDNKINKHQHGFIKGKSCLTNLLETMDCIIEIIDQGDPVDIFISTLRKLLTVSLITDYCIRLNA